MHIKNIIINNFKSFHGFNLIEDITPGHNVIVGDNGAGKSIFLQAIDFLLRFENKEASKVNMSNLLSQRETIGFIEILFSGCEAPFDKEITIRKEFSSISNIRFYVNGKRIDKKKIKALHEALSFNYMHSSFVMTPKMVQKFVKFSRKELLDYLMKHMGATLLKTYETIQKIFLVLEGQKEKIDNLLDLFHDVEINDGENYFMLLKKHKKIRNDIIAEILRKKIKKLSKISTQLEGDLASLKKCSIDVSGSSTVSLLQYSYSQIETALHDKKGILNVLIKENCKLIEKKEKIHLLVQDITKTISLMKKGNEETFKCSNESQAENKIKLISDELDNVTKEFVSKKNIIKELDSQKQLKEEMRLNLLTKIQRTKDFQSKEERNSQLQVKVNLISKQIQNIEAEVNILSIRKEELTRSNQFMHGEIEELKKQLQEQEESFDQNISQAKQQLNNFFNLMSDYRREVRILEDKISENSLNIQEKVLQLKKKIGSATIVGAESLLAVIEACKSSQSHKWLSDGYYGMVIENFECPEELSIAVESAIGNRLFAHIVANNRTGTNILKEINYHKLAGEVLFLPIESLIVTSYNYPICKDAEPILNRMNFKPHMEKVMKYLFGHILICKNIDIAINIMRKTRGLKCVTLDGDKVSKSVMTGGYFSMSKCSKILFSEINGLQQKSMLINEELENLQNKINELEGKINRSISYKQKLKMKYPNTNLKENLQRLIDNEKNASQELININGLIESKKRSVKGLRLSQKMLIEEISEDFEEINEKINDKVIFVNKEIKEFEKILHKQNLELTKIESKKIMLKNDLSHQENLRSLQELDTSEMKACMKKLKDYKVKEELIDNRIKIIAIKTEETEKSITDLIIEKLKLEEDLKDSSELDVSVGRRDKITKKLMLYNNRISKYKAIYKKIHASSSHSNEYSEFTLPMLYNELKNMNQIVKSVLENNETERRKKKITRLYKKYERLYNGFTNNYVKFSNFVEWFHSYIEQCLNSVSEIFSKCFELLTSGGNANLFLDYDESSGSPLENEQKKLVCHQILNLEGQVQSFTASHSQEWIELGKEVYHVTFKYSGSNIKKITAAEVAHFLKERQPAVAQFPSFSSGGDTISSRLAYF